MLVRVSMLLFVGIVRPCPCPALVRKFLHLAANSPEIDENYLYSSHFAACFIRVCHGSGELVPVRQFRYC